MISPEGRRAVAVHRWGPESYDEGITWTLLLLALLLPLYLVLLFRTLVMAGIDPEYRWSFLISRTVLMAVMVLF